MSKRDRLEQWETMEAIKDTLRTVSQQGYGECKLCGYKAYGDNFDDILRELGGHGEYFHKGYFEASPPRRG
jgi:hypothetical protein